MGDLIILKPPARPECGCERLCGNRQTEYLRHLYGLLDRTVLPGRSKEDAEDDLTVYKRRIRLFSPNCAPHGLINELRNVFVGRTDIYCIYVLLACHPDDDVPHLLILIDFDGERASIFPAVVKTVCRYIKPGEPFEVMQADAIMLNSALKCAMPIYHKLRILR